MELQIFVQHLDENAHPAYVWAIQQECYHQVRLGTRWCDIGILELDLMVLLHVCQHRHMVREVQQVLAKNQFTPLNYNDAERLSALYNEFQRYPAEFRGLPISMECLHIMIELAACGYEHSSDIEAVA